MQFALLKKFQCLFIIQMHTGKYQSHLVATYTHTPPPPPPPLSCLTRATKSLFLDEKYWGIFLAQSGEWPISRKGTRQKEQQDKVEEQERRQKWESNDSPGIPDKGGGGGGDGNQTSPTSLRCGVCGVGGGGGVYIGEGYQPSIRTSVRYRFGSSFSSKRL